MCILLGSLEIARNHYFSLVEHEDKKEAAKQAIREKTTKSLNIFLQKEEHFKVKKWKQRNTCIFLEAFERYGCAFGSEQVHYFRLNAKTENLMLVLETGLKTAPY